MSSSSPITAPRVSTVVRDSPDLFAVLAGLPDPRRGGARRHPLGDVLALVVMAYGCAGFASLTGATQWAKAASPEPPRRLGARPDPLTGAVVAPSEATIRRIASRLDPAALEAAAAWTAACGAGTSTHATTSTWRRRCCGVGLRSRSTGRRSAVPATPGTAPRGRDPHRPRAGRGPQPGYQAFWLAGKVSIVAARRAAALNPKPSSASSSHPENRTNIRYDGALATHPLLRTTSDVYPEQPWPDIRATPGWRQS